MLFVALVIREPEGVFITAVCANALALAAGLATLTPRLEMRALRNDVARPGVTRAQGRRWALGSVIVGTGALIVGLLAVVLTGDWFPLGIAMPIALMGALFAIFAIREARRSEP